MTRLDHSPRPSDLASSPPIDTPSEMVAGGWLIVGTSSALLVVALVELAAFLGSLPAYGILFLLLPISVFIMVALAVGLVWAIIDLSTDATTRSPRNLGVVCAGGIILLSAVAGALVFAWSNDIGF